MLLNISSPSISHRNPHFLSPLNHLPPRSKTHLSKSHLYPNPSAFPNQTLRNRAPFGNKSPPHGERLRLRPKALPGIDLGSFESVLEATAVLTAIIVVHESGHFLAATLQGIHVSKFAVGFGPILAKFDFKNVEYSLRAFPLGGFVGFPDNDPDSEIATDDENLLKNRPVLDRSIVVSAGIIANVIFAYVIIFVQVLSVGLPVQEAFPGVLVPEVKTFSAASRDGLLSGDVILSVDGAELSKTGPDAVSKVVDIVKRSPESDVLFRIERGNQDLVVRVRPNKNFDGTGKIGVQLSPNVRITKVRPRNVPEAFRFAGKEFMGLSSNVLDGLKQTFFNFSQTASKVAGPVAIIAVGAEVARSNTDGLYQFAALLNINLAVINLLPLPALDGGTLALILLEAVALRLLNSISSSSAAASLPHRFGGLLTNHHRLMADSSFSVAIRRAASFISAVLRSDRKDTVLEEAAICSVLTNAVEVQDRAGVALGIAVYGSRFSWINHSCSPNACYRFVISPPHSTTTPSFQETLPRITTNTDKEHFSSNYEGTVRYGPKVIVRSIKGIKSGEEITVSYIDLLQPTGLRQSDLWSKYRFICNCGRCDASPPAYVDYILEGVVALEHDITTVGHHDRAATVGKMTNHIKEAIDDFLSDDIDPATCCEKIEGVLHHGILDSSSLRLHPSHHVALHAYITLASAYRIRSFDSETDDVGRAFEMSRIGAAYSLFLAGVSHHLVSAELSFAISAANFWTRAGECLLELASKFFMKSSSGEYDDDVKCRKCLMLVENHGEIKENFNQILKCAVTDSSQATWSFLTRGCPYLQNFKSSIDFSLKGTNCKREESKSVDQRVSILLLSFHCLLYADLLTDLCYGRKSHSVS